MLRRSQQLLVSRSSVSLCGWSKFTNFICSSILRQKCTQKGSGDTAQQFWCEVLIVASYKAYVAHDLVSRKDCALTVQQCPGLLSAGPRGVSCSAWHKRARSANVAQSTPACC